MRNHGSQLLLLAAAATLAATLGCNSDTAPLKAAAASPMPSAPAKTTDAMQDYSTTAPVFTENEVEVVAQREGVIQSVAVELGQRVHKGQVLAALDDRQLKADYDSASSKARSLAADSKNWEAELKVAEADEQRAQSLYTAQLMTKEQLDHAHYKTVASQFEVERQHHDQITAESAAESLGLELQKMRITAPFDGVIARRYISSGQHVAVSDHLFWIVGDTALRVRFMIPEARMNSIKQGGKVQVASIYAPEEHAEARIIAVSPAVDPGTGSIEAVAEIPSKASLKAGMTVQVTVPKN